MCKLEIYVAGMNQQRKMSHQPKNNLKLCMPIKKIWDFLTSLLKNIGTGILESWYFCKGQQAISSSELHHSQSEQKAYSIPFIRNASLVCHNTFCTTLLDASPFSTNRFYSRPGHFEIMPKIGIFAMLFTILHHVLTRVKSIIFWNH